MIVRVRLHTGPRIAKATGKNRHIAFAVAALLWPGVLAAYSLAMWALASQLSIAGRFAISSGVLSHWQVWVAMGVALQLSAWGLGRYGRTGDMRLPSHLISRISGFGSRRA